MKTAPIGLLTTTLLTCATLAACGGATDGTTSTTSASTLRSGVFTDCTLLDSGGALYSVGSDATLTLTASDAGVVLTFANGSEPTATVHLTSTSATSATLAGPGETFPGKWGYCGGGETSSGAIADPGPTEANLSLSTALVSVDEGVVFLSLVGPVTAVAGNADCPPDTSSGPLTAQIVCGTAAPAPDADDSGAAAGGATGSAFAPGTYDCNAETSKVTDSGMYNSGVSSTGTLALSRSATGLSVTYSGDTEASGTLAFTPTSDGSANPVPGQSFSVACGIFSATDPAPVNPPTVTEVTAGTLTTDGTTVFLSFLGDVPSGGCSPQTSSTVLECTPH